MLGALTTSIRRRSAVTAVAILAAAIVPLTAGPAHAAIIAVAAGEVAVADNDVCSLREAVDNANDDAQTHDDCTGGTGVDTIQVPAGNYLFGAGDQLNLTDPDLTTISGAGATTILNGQGTTRILNIFFGATVAISAATITNGFAAFAGGGIVNNGTLTLTDSTLSGNHASALGGGGGIGNGGTLTVTNSTLSGNTAGHGGAIDNVPGGTVTVTNSTLSGNTATTGGGIANTGGTVTVTNSTLSGNTANVGFGGGIVNSGGTVSLLATIVANSVGGNCSGAIVDGGNNLSFPDACDVIVAGPDPQLGPLANNGGPTLTHALLPMSPAIDAAAACNPPITTDQRGVARPQGPACDIGAYERTVTPPGGGGDGDDDHGGGESGRRGRITIVEDVRPDRDVAFGFHTKDLKAPTFRLADNHKRDFKDLKAGTYTVAQDQKDGWKLDRIVCADPTKNTKVVLDTRRAEIKLKAGEHVTCTFTNKRK